MVFQTLSQNICGGSGISASGLRSSSRRTKSSRPNKVVVVAKAKQNSNDVAKVAGSVVGGVLGGGQAAQAAGPKLPEGFDLDSLYDLTDYSKKATETVEKTSQAVKTFSVEATDAAEKASGEAGKALESLSSSASGAAEKALDSLKSVEAEKALDSLTSSASGAAEKALDSLKSIEAEKALDSLTSSASGAAEKALDSLKSVEAEKALDSLTSSASVAADEAEKQAEKALDALSGVTGKAGDLFGGFQKDLGNMTKEAPSFNLPKFSLPEVAAPKVQAPPPPPAAEPSSSGGSLFDSFKAEFGDVLTTTPEKVLKTAPPAEDIPAPPPVVDFPAPPPAPVESVAPPPPPPPPPAVEITPPAVEVTPAPVEITPAPVEITPAPIEITPAPVEVAPTPVPEAPAVELESIKEAAKDVVGDTVDTVKEALGGTVDSVTEAAKESVGQAVAPLQESLQEKLGAATSQIDTSALSIPSKLTSKLSNFDAKSTAVSAADQVRGAVDSQVADVAKFISRSAARSLPPEAYDVLKDLSGGEDVAGTLLTLTVGLPLFIAIVVKVAGSLGYAGDVEPADVLEALTTDKKAILIDTRSESELILKGVPDLRGRARSRVVLCDVETLTNSLRREMRNPKEIEVAIFATKVKAVVGENSDVYFLDSNGGTKNLARAVAAMGGVNAYVVNGGFRKWELDGLRTKENYDVGVGAFLSEEAEDLTQPIIERTTNTIEGFKSDIDDLKNASPLELTKYAGILLGLLAAAYNYETVLELIGIYGLILTFIIKSINTEGGASAVISNSASSVGDVIGTVQKTAVSAGEAASSLQSKVQAASDSGSETKKEESKK